MAVSVKVGATIEAGVPKVLFQTRLAVNPQQDQYCVTGDGAKFLFGEPVEEMPSYEEGRFLLDDPVSKFIPEFKNPKVLVKPASGPTYTIPATHEITIRNLLTHTSGLTYHSNSDLGQLYKDANVAHGVLQYDGTIHKSKESRKPQNREAFSFRAPENHAAAARQRKIIIENTIGMMKK